MEGGHRCGSLRRRTDIRSADACRAGGEFAEPAGRCGVAGAVDGGHERTWTDSQGEQPYGLPREMKVDDMLSGLRRSHRGWIPRPH
jgi:hypothetical protein